MKIFRRKKANRDKDVYKTAACATFMAPVGDDGEPIMNAIMSHQHNSHTIVPKIPMGNTDYIEEF